MISHKKKIVPYILADLSAYLSAYLFVVHTLTARAAPFVTPGLFKDRNFLTGSIFIFILAPAAS